MELALRHGLVDHIDDADAELVAGFRVYAKQDSKSGAWYAYARRSGIATPLHRLILGLVKGDNREGEHIDCDGLNNRRSNLRIANRSENNCNRHMRRDNTSGYKGVSKHPKRPSEWVAQIMHHKKGYNLGSFPTPDEAYAAYCGAAKVLHGKFARPEKRAA
jgi:hypothetical protein